MANTSILAAFERMWQHIVVALSSKSDKDHTHDDYYTVSDIDSKLSTKSDTSHGHSISEISSLQLALDDKANKATTLEGYGITDAASKSYVDTLIDGLTTEGTADANVVQAALNAHTDDKANPHCVTLSQLGVTVDSIELNYVSGTTSNIQDQLNDKATKNHQHNEYATTTSVANKADTSYVDEKLDTKANSVHTHDEYLTMDDIESIKNDLNNTSQVQIITWEAGD